MSTAPREWKCPGCARESTSSRAVRARYCPRCGVWCVRTDAGDVEEPDPVLMEQAKTVGDLLRAQRPEVLFEDPGVFYGFGGRAGQA